MDKVSGKDAKGQWYDPRKGGWTAIGRFVTKGTHEFQPPTHGEKSDWVLVIDNAGKELPEGK
jgi:hypothetical protein